MEALRLGSKGQLVKNWQLFLIGRKYVIGNADGIFGKLTDTATKDFQSKNKLTADGIVGNATFAKAMQYGFPMVDVPIPNTNKGTDWPGKPSFPPLVSTAARAKVFGGFKYKVQPVPGNREHIVVLDDWASKNIVSVDIPQLAGITGAPKSHKVTFHRLAANQLQKLWSDWEKSKLLDRVLTWAGSYVPRLVRGGTSLSNHAFGTAFDINVAWNQLGHMPALVGQKGCVRELVEIANANGFYWGGHFSRRDGMHFEIAQLKK